MIHLKQWERRSSRWVIDYFLYWSVESGALTEHFSIGGTLNKSAGKST